MNEETKLTAAAEQKLAKVVFQPSGRRGQFTVGTPLLDAARSLGVYVESVCGGRGIAVSARLQFRKVSLRKRVLLVNAVIWVKLPN